MLPEVYYGELQGIARATSFSVAGLASLDQLQGVLDSLAEALGQGETMDEWKKRAPLTLPAHRLENVFRTNLQGAYARERCEHIARHKDRRPYLLYSAVNDSRTRPAHAAMHGTLLPVDHPWWKTHTPPNGYQCRCTVISLTEAQAQARGGVKYPPAGADPDPGWDYSPCEAGEGVGRAVEERIRNCGKDLSGPTFGRRRVRDGLGRDTANGFLTGLLKPRMPNPLAPMPAPRDASSVTLFPDDLRPEQYFRRFMDLFGEREQATVVLPRAEGDPFRLIIDRGLLLDQHGSWNITKGDRQRYLPLLAECIGAPDECWLLSGKLYLLSRFMLRTEIGAMCVFEETGLTWTGVTGYYTRDLDYLARKRAELQRHAMLVLQRT